MIKAVSVPKWNLFEAIWISRLRRYFSHELGIYDLLEKSDRRLYTKISRGEYHPLYSILPTVKSRF